ncbi:MAG TPA: Asp-tRNA(Asn)/Glu-tRNA(Gln) amidotransferase subunit GatA, partial [Firmicutes bacterium]|nr:Asp-tRNA(Asn)/Glu-tRNA(Gln) amidotransferase subunit GatA [Bacillota bacterium]
DLILTPAAPTIAPSFEDKTDKLSDEYLIADNHLVLGNFSGLPSLTMPIGIKQGLPFGLQVMGRLFEEATVMRFALEIEKLTGLKNLMAPHEVTL